MYMDPYSDRFEREHRDLHDTVERIEGELAQLRGGPWGDGRVLDRKELAEMLQDFALGLRSHFRLEETEGPLASATGDPEREQRIGRLLSEHRELEDKTDCLIDGLLDSSSGVGAPELTDRTRELLAHLARHERLEREVVRGSWRSLDAGAG